ncbi:UxaA family hydrolase [Lederbergia wuyishanensis]|uniref:Altronate dehydratase large subunit n=1 Tax=Lederbergia wuyishanensis TaxID=1347903 RepID=A0ABU0D447_9BACI|nr:UxaA family hydrolase [Lederbergia wuyishanensis]MCJ8008242.1 UxaA family hydrolase [Lederbergia wuyishanensis]MDQ0343169.1 altronate dehydratase large subunit [Lederbergia wuyishanensis]
MQTFKGYRRENGKFGIRNHLLILPTVVCANQVCSRIQQQIPNSVAIPHQHGCSQVGSDKERTHKVLVGMGKNPNVGAVLIVSLGCEVINAEEVKADIETTGKPVIWIDIQTEGGSIKTIQKGIEEARKLMKLIEDIPVEDVPASELIVGVKCGGSDFTSGLCSNPALGKAADLILNSGGTIVMGETTEIIGAEHLVAAKAVNEQVKEKLYDCIKQFEDEIERMGVDMRGGNPSPGNIEGGLSSIEEKSLGCISKAGTAPLEGVVDFAEEIPGKGYYFMDSPGNDIECVTGMAAAGVHVVCFTTGRGTPTGNPIIPVIKITGNELTAKRMADNIDVDTSGVLLGKETLDESGEKIHQFILDVANGEQTKAEILGHTEFSISRIGISL